MSNPVSRLAARSLALCGLLLLLTPQMFTRTAWADAANEPVHLGTAANFAILSEAGITTTGVTAIVGHVGVSPIASTAMTGFGLTMDSSGEFSRSPVVTGNVYAADYAAPTPTLLGTAISNMETAYTDAEGRTNPIATELGAGNIGGMTLPPGLYKWSSDVMIPSEVILSGPSTGVWIFQIAGTLNISSGVQIQLSGGAHPGNIFWQVAGQTTLETSSVFQGNILGKTAIVIKDGAALNGRALAQTAVTLDGNAITRPLPPTTPTNLAVTAATPSDTRLTWTDTSIDEEGFQVMRWDAVSAVYTPVAFMGADATTYLDSGHVPGRRYVYYVQAFNSTGISRGSNKAWIAAPAAPTGLAVTVLSPTLNLLSWVDNSDNELYFGVMRWDPVTAVYTPVGGVGANTRTFTNGGLVPGRRYIYYVQAHNFIASSSGSNKVSVVLPAS
jgi:hypothetical protein